MNKQELFYDSNNYLMSSRGELEPMLKWPFTASPSRAACLTGEEEAARVGRDSGLLQR